jgi:hypothetical protein
MLVSPSDVITTFSNINGNYSLWSESFVRHVEVRLIDYPSKLKRRPSEIGVSKLCSRPTMFGSKPLTRKTHQK